MRVLLPTRIYPKKVAHLMSLQERYQKPLLEKWQGKRLLSPKESMAYTGLARDVVYALIRNRAIPYIIRPGAKSTQFLIDRLDWDKWIERRKIPVIA